VHNGQGSHTILGCILSSSAAELCPSLRRTRTGCSRYLQRGAKLKRERKFRSEKKKTTAKSLFGCYVRFDVDVQSTDHQNVNKTTR
jgi:hypothetical protein